MLEIQRINGVPLSRVDDSIAEEKGRLLAAQAIARNPEQMKRVEDIFGKPYCMNRWPEAYKKTPFFQNIIDKMKFVTW